MTGRPNRKHSPSTLSLPGQPRFPTNPVFNPTDRLLTVRSITKPDVRVVVLKNARFSVALLVSAIVMLAGVPAAYAAPSVETLDVIRTPWPVHAEGVTDVAAETGTIRLQPETLTGIQMRAEAMTFEFEWGRGYEARAGQPIADVIIDEGKETVRVQNVDVRFERIQGDPLFVAFTDDSPQEISVKSKSHLVFESIEDETVASVGPSPDSFNADESVRLSFWHKIAGPALHATGPGTVKIAGSFTLLADDVVMHVDEDKGSWSRWTGYQESDPGQTVTEFEVRLTTIQVENGTFVSYAQEAIDLFNLTMDAAITGTIETQDATGRLLGTEEIFFFDNDSMLLEGTGNILFESTSPEDGSVGLLMMPEGDFDIQGASTVETVERHSGPYRWNDLVFLAGLLTASLVAIGFFAYRSGPVLATAYRNRKSNRWMTRAKNAYLQRQLQHASHCYEKAVRAKPDDAFAWYKWAQTELELGDAAAAERIASNAANVNGMDPLDLLDLRACAAWQRQDLETLEAFLRELAAESREHALNFLNDFGISPSVFGSRLRRDLEGPALEEGLEGYA